MCLIQVMIVVKGLHFPIGFFKSFLLFAAADCLFDGVKVLDFGVLFERIEDVM